MLFKKKKILFIEKKKGMVGKLFFFLFIIFLANVK